MAISYSIIFESSGCSDDVVKLFTSELGFSLNDTCRDQLNINEIVRLTSHDFYVLIGKRSSDQQEILWQDLEIKCDREIIFFTGSEFRTNGAEGKLLTEYVIFLLKRTMGNFVFLFDGELILLLRNSTGLYINSDAGFWNTANENVLATYTSFISKPLPTI